MMAPMPQDATSTGHHPATLRERGVCLLCTTPMLVGARVRQADRDGLELVVPRAAGVRGEYVAPWSGIGDLCRPTVHDTRLLVQVGTLRTITPAEVREAAWQAASEGFGGRGARAAAAAAMAAAHDARLLTHYHLLATLVRHTEAGLPSGPLRTARIEAVARRTVARLAAELGRDAAAIGAALGALAVLYAPLGLGGQVGTARVPGLVAMIQSLRRDVAAMGQDADPIVRTADFTLACLVVTLAEARGAADSVPGLLKAWLADPAGMATWISRADWLTDGWGWLCHRWSLAEGPAARRGALEDMLAVLPPVPREAIHWSGAGTAPPRPTRSAVACKEGMDAVLRNETLLALAA